MLHDAKRPIIVIGNRVAHRAASDDLRAVCEAHQIPCASVDYAKGVIPEDHPLYLGVIGQSGHDSVVEYVCESDLALTLGVRMSAQTTSRYDPAMFRHLVQIDDDPAEIARNGPVRFGVVGDVPASIRFLLSALGPGEANRDSAALVASLRTKRRVFDQEKSHTDTSPLTTPRLLRILREQLPRETLVVADTGLTAQLVKHHFPVYAKDGFYALYGLAAMGSGLPMSLGVSLGRSDVPVVSIIGDGGFLVHAGELNVAAQHKIPVIHVVVVNGAYKQVEDRMRAWFNRTYACTIAHVDFVKLAESFGCDGYRAMSASELRTSVALALERKRPCVIEVPVCGDNLMDIMPQSLKDLNERMFADSTDHWPFGTSFPAASRCVRCAEVERGQG